MTDTTIEACDCNEGKPSWMRGILTGVNTGEGVQACGDCLTFDSDLTAAHALAERVGGVVWFWQHNGSLDAAWDAAARESGMANVVLGGMSREELGYHKRGGVSGTYCADDYVATESEPWIEVDGSPVNWTQYWRIASAMAGPARTVELVQRENFDGLFLFERDEDADAYAALFSWEGAAPVDRGSGIVLGEVAARQLIEETAAEFAEELAESAGEALEYAVITRDRHGYGHEPASYYATTVADAVQRYGKHTGLDAADIAAHVVNEGSKG